MEIEEKKPPQEIDQRGKRPRVTPLKKPYAPPRLTVHGRVEEVTRSLGGSGGDILRGSVL